MDEILHHLRNPGMMIPLWIPTILWKSLGTLLRARSKHLGSVSQVPTSMASKGASVHIDKRNTTTRDGLLPRFSQADDGSSDQPLKWVSFSVATSFWLLLTPLQNVKVFVDPMETPLCPES